METETLNQTLATALPQVIAKHFAKAKGDDPKLADSMVKITQHASQSNGAVEYADLVKVTEAVFEALRDTKKVPAMEGKLMLVSKPAFWRTIASATALTVKNDDGEPYELVRNAPQVPSPDQIKRVAKEQMLDAKAMGNIGAFALAAHAKHGVEALKPAALVDRFITSKKDDAAFQSRQLEAAASALGNAIAALSAAGADTDRWEAVRADLLSEARAVKARKPNTVEAAPEAEAEKPKKQEAFSL